MSASPSRPIGFLLLLSILATMLVGCGAERPVSPTLSASTSSLTKAGAEEWFGIVDEGYDPYDLAQTYGWTVLTWDEATRVAEFLVPPGSSKSFPPGPGFVDLEQTDPVEGFDPIDVVMGFWETIPLGAFPDQQSLNPLGHGVAHDRGLTGAGIRVALVDTGVDSSHPYLMGHIDYGSSTKYDNRDEIGHGTMLAGLVVTMAPDAIVQPIRVFGPDGASEADLVRGLIRARDDQADVVNLSFRVTGGTSPTMESIIQDIVDQGGVVTGSAGNTTGYPTYPARLPNVLSFAATDYRDELADFTAYEGVDFAAPGVDVLTTYLMVPGDPRPSWAVASGTSISAAIGAGVAAVYLGSTVDKPIDLMKDEAKVVSHHLVYGRVDLLPLVERNPLLTPSGNPRLPRP